MTVRSWKVKGSFLKGLFTKVVAGFREQSSLGLQVLGEGEAPRHKRREL